MSQFYSVYQFVTDPTIGLGIVFDMFLFVHFWKLDLKEMELYYVTEGLFAVL